MLDRILLIRKADHDGHDSGQRESDGPDLKCRDVGAGGICKISSGENPERCGR